MSLVIPLRGYTYSQSIRGRSLPIWIPDKERLSFQLRVINLNNLNLQTWTMPKTEVFHCWSSRMKIPRVAVTSTGRLYRAAKFTKFYGSDLISWILTWFFHGVPTRLLGPIATSGFFAQTTRGFQILVALAKVALTRSTKAGALGLWFTHRWNS